MQKTILITGATDGIGKATAELLAWAGHKIIIHARTAEKGERISNEIRQTSGNNSIEYVTANFESLSQIAEMVSGINTRYSKIDVLINNAGVYRKTRNVLSNGFEETFMINHLAHFFLTLKLLPLLREQEQTQIINVSSMVHATNIDFDNLQGEKHYNGSDAYSRSKLCNMLLTNQLANQLKHSNITVNALHPGVVQTKLLEAGWGAMGENPTNSAKRFAFLIDNENLINVTGKYFMNNQQTNPASIANQKSAMEKLWEISSNLISQQGFYYDE